MQVGVLVGQALALGLRPHHERVHRAPYAVHGRRRGRHSRHGDRVVIMWCVMMLLIMIVIQV